MKKKLEINKKVKTVFIFCVLSTMCLFGLFLGIIFSHGELIDNYFFYDTKDTGMDFFHSVEYVNGLSPYDTFNTLYPPLANLFFSLIFSCIPTSVSDKWPLDFVESVHMRASNMDLRVSQAPMLAFVFFVIISVYFFAVLIQNQMKNQPLYLKGLIAFNMIFSYGYLMAIERGNILLLTVPLTMFFVFYHNDENKIIKEIALVSIALAAGLKIYPAIFGLLLLKDKRWKEAIRTIFYGISTVIVPCFFFKEGLGAIKIWLKVMFNFGENPANPWIGNGFENLLNRLKRYLEVFAHITISDKYFSVISLVVVLMLVVCAMFMKEEWKSCLILVLSMILFQDQGDYIFSFVTIPLVIFLQQQTYVTRENIVPFLCMSLLVVPVPLFYERDLRYPHNILVQCTLCILIIWSIISMIMQKNKKIENAKSS